MRVLTCVPKQEYTFKGKLDWIDRTAKKHGPIDLFVTPQEMFGGIQVQLFKEKTDLKLAYQAEQVLDPIMALAKKHDMGIAVGLVEDDPKLQQRRERVYIVDPKNGPTGFFDKMMLPAYDHVDAKSPIGITPETDLRNRCRVAKVKGAKVSVLFCWEVYSNYLWHAMTVAQPDMVLSMIKFGVCGWPQKGKDANGGSIVVGFGYGSDGGWIDRLAMGAQYDVAAPVFCSTNSWDLPNRSRPLAGMIHPWDPEKSTLWFPEKGTRGPIVEHVQVDEIDHIAVRFWRGNKFSYHEATGEWPESKVREYTMMWKVKRMERKYAGLPTSLEMPDKPTTGLRSRSRSAGQGSFFDQ